jgi:nitronate monooxygenase
LRAKAEAQGSGDFSPLWSGQGPAPVADRSAGDLTRKLADEALARMGCR